MSKHITYVEVFKKGQGWIVRTNKSEDPLICDAINADVALLMALRHLHLYPINGVADVQMERAVWVRDADEYDCRGGLIFGLVICVLLVCVVSWGVSVLF